MEIKKSLLKEKNGEKHKLLQDSEISLILDTYEDIFSDFDPRPFIHRSLSMDFLEEAKRATRDLPDGRIQLKFLIPYSLRNIPTEMMIRKRLKEHFAKHFLEYKREMKIIKIKGGLMTFAGILMIFFAASLSSISPQAFAIRFLQTLLEPAGWFTAWVGLENAFESLAEESKTKKFYERMSLADVSFIGY